MARCRRPHHRVHRGAPYALTRTAIATRILRPSDCAVSVCSCCCPYTPAVIPPSTWDVPVDKVTGRCGQKDDCAFQLLDLPQRPAGVRCFSQAVKSAFCTSDCVSSVSKARPEAVDLDAVLRQLHIPLVSILSAPFDAV